MEQVIVTIDKYGVPIIEVKGVAGRSCKDVTAELERAFGVVVEDRLTPEYYRQDAHVRQGR